MAREKGQSLKCVSLCIDRAGVLAARRPESAFPQHGGRWAAFRQGRLRVASLRQLLRVARMWHRGRANPANARAPQPAPAESHAQQLETPPMPIWEVILLGLIEGVTEFLPVSSTGPPALDRALSRRLLARQDVRGADPARRHPGDPERLRGQAHAASPWRFPTIARARRFVLGILLAFLPAAVIGAAAHDFIKGVLFESPMLISIMLVVGGIILLAIDRMPLAVRYDDVMDYPPSLSFKIGFFQCLAHGARRVALGRDHRRRHADGHRQALGGRVLLLPRHADDDRRLRLRSLQELVDPQARGRHQHRLGLRRRLHLRGVRRALSARLREPARVCAVRLVAHHRRRHRAGRHAGARATERLPASPG